MTDEERKQAVELLRKALIGLRDFDAPLKPVDEKICKVLALLKPCPTCEGSDEVIDKRPYGENVEGDIMKCPTCQEPAEKPKSTLAVGNTGTQRAVTFDKKREPVEFVKKAKELISSYKTIFPKPMGIPELGQACKIIEGQAKKLEAAEAELEISKSVNQIMSGRICNLFNHIQKIDAKAARRFESSVDEDINYCKQLESKNKQLTAEVERLRKQIHKNCETASEMLKCDFEDIGDEEHEVRCYFVGENLIRDILEEDSKALQQGEQE